MRWEIWSPNTYSNSLLFILSVLFLKINKSRKVDSILSCFSQTSNVHGMNSWLFKNSFPFSLCPYISVGVVPVRVEFGSRSQMWVEQCLCVQTQSPLCTDRWPPPHITIGVPTCLIGRELVYNILTFRFCFWNAFLMFSWFTFGHMLNKWMEKLDSILSQTAWIS